MDTVPPVNGRTEDGPVVMRRPRIVVPWLGGGGASPLGGVEKSCDPPTEGGGASLPGGWLLLGGWLTIWLPPGGWLLAGGALEVVVPQP